MSTGAVLAIVAAVLVLAAVAAASATAREGGGARLKRRFGPEYDRTLARYDGDDRATRQELTERVRKYRALDRRPLDRESRERYGARWQAAQARFVDEPAAAVAEADRLIGGLAAGCGFPAAGSDEHFDALSVHHPHAVQGYRQAHALADHAGAGGRRATEDLRRALVAARGLFDELLDAAPEAPAAVDGTPEPEREPEVPEYDPDLDREAAYDTADAHAATEHATDDAADDPAPAAGDAPPRRTPLAARLATLTAPRRSR
jgi:hypothetical protein